MPLAPSFWGTRLVVRCLHLRGAQQGAGQRKTLAPGLRPQGWALCLRGSASDWAASHKSPLRVPRIRGSRNCLGDPVDINVDKL